MDSGHNGVPEREQRLDAVVAAYLQAVEAGQPPQRQELLRRHADLLPELAQFFEDADALGGLALRPRALGPALERTGAGVGETIAAGKELGDFRIVREVGRGGMGIVYEAEQLSLGRRVALKVLPFAATMDPRHLQRFHNEARAAACLQHAHIVPAYFVGCERSVHFYAMQFIEGKSLAELIAVQRYDAMRRERPSPHPPSHPETDAPCSRDAITQVIATATTQATPRDTAHFRRIAQWGIQAAEALEHAHSLGIVHRDIKPSNLMIDGAGKLWVTDFGLARTATDPGLTITGDVLGTLRYMSPEQALAKHSLVDHRSDIYSLGATLYELLTLRPVVDEKDREAILGKITYEEPPSPRSVDRAIPADLETIVLKALAKEPAERYATAQELADDLRRFVDDRPIRARRPSWLQRARRWFRRHQVTITAVTMTLAVTLSISIVLLWHAHDGTLAALHDVEVQRGQVEEQRNRAVERELHARRQLYAAHIAAAQRAWRVAELGAVQRLLERYIPQPGEADLRGFEWHYLWGQARGRKESLRILRGHSGDVYCVQFSPDGKLLATAGKDHTVRLWDPATGRERGVLRGHDADVNWAAFSPDGDTLATASDDGAVKLWNLQTGQETGQLLKGPVPVVGVAFSPDGKTLAAGRNDGMLRWWHLPSGQERPSFRAHDSRIEFVSFSPDGRTLATCAENPKLWDVATGKLQRLLLPGVDKVNCIRFSHRSTMLAIGGRRLNIHVWDPATGQRLQQFASSTSAAVESLAFSPDDRMLATTDRDGAVRLWDARTGKLLDLLTGHAGLVWCVAFSPDGRTLATTGQDGTVRLWDPDARSDRKVLASPTRSCKLAFSPDGKRLVGAGYVKNEGGLIVWNIPSGRLERFASYPHPFSALALSPDGKTAATRDIRGLVTVWDLDKVQPRLTFRTEGMAHSLAFTADGKILLTCGPKSLVSQWEVSTGHLIGDLVPGKFSQCLVYSPAKGMVAVPTGPDGIVLWDLPSGNSRIIPWPIAKANTQGVAAFSPDGSILAGWSDSSVFLWDVASGRVLFSLPGHPGIPQTMSFSADGKTLASLADGEVKLWSVLTGQEMLSLEDHRSPIDSIAFDPNGRMLATSCAVEGSEHEVHLWRPPDGPQAAQPSPSSVNGTGR